MLSPTEEIKQRLDIADVVGGYIKLHKAGANFKGLCPFHGEKTPSFMVSRQKQMWYCFGCNTGGDVFSFVMKVEGLEFADALKLLADRAGVSLPQYDPKLKSARSGLIAALESARDFFSRMLFSPLGETARIYFGKRGLDEKTVRAFGLGYAPNSWDALLKELSKTYKPQELFAAGLVIKKDGRADEGVGHFYDRFRHRLMFPIADAHGNVVGFTARILDESQQGGKYINTPETSVYNKGRMLYGFDLAKAAIRERDAAVVMEGNMDVITAHQFGFKNTVASSGTALTADQLRLIGRFTKNIILAFDADAAGQAAMKRGIDLALIEGMRVRVVEIPEWGGKDPDDCIRKNTSDWAKVVEEAVDILSWYFKKARKAYNRDSPQGRRDFAAFVLPEIARLPSAVERDFWLKTAASDLSIAQEVIEEEFKRITRGMGPSVAAAKPSAPAAAPAPTHRAVMEERLLALIACRKEIRAQAAQTLRQEYLSDPGRRECLNAIFSGGVSEDPELRRRLDILELQGEKDFEDWTEKAIVEELSILLASVYEVFLKDRRLELTRAMREAEREGNQALIAQLSKTFEEFTRPAPRS
ncbi:MAG: DNA primase [Patescibacteria group bacterium]